MKRIELTRKDERILPVTINGTDIDLAFDAGSLETKDAIVSMMDDILSYQKRGKNLVNINEVKENEEKAISEIRKFTNDGIALCKNLSVRFGEIFPSWADAVKDNFIDVSIFTELLSAIMEIIMEKETNDKVSEDIETER